MVPLLVFDGTNYQVWAIRIEAYLNGSDFWEAIEDKYEVPPFPNSPNMAQIKLHKGKKQKNSKQEQACLELSHVTYFPE